MEDWKPKQTYHAGGKSNALKYTIAGLIGAAVIGYAARDHISDKVMTSYNETKTEIRNGLDGKLPEKTITAYNGVNGDYVIDGNNLYMIEDVAVKAGDKLDLLLRKYNPNVDFGNEENKLNMRDEFNYVNGKELTDFLNSDVTTGATQDKMSFTYSPKANSGLRAETRFKIPVLVDSK
jgi:hypothetical protein